jgi:hypothetical protein
MRDRVAVHSVIDDVGGRRIAIYRRPDGCFTYAEEVRGCWGAVTGIFRATVSPLSQGYRDE